jgi:3-oxoadipate enol-lactonase
MPSATLDDVRVHYQLDGDPDSVMLVLSNGLGTDLRMWDPQIPALTRHFQILRYDTRGHGGSSVPSRGATIDRLGRDVLQLLDHLRVDRVHFCGLSLGGMTGMWLGVHAPDRLRSLALANTSARIGPPDMWNTRIAAVNASGMTAISKAAMVRWFTPDYMARQPAAVASLKDMFERTSPAGYVSCSVAIRDADLRAEIARIAVPTLVITGRHDVGTPPAAGQFLAARIEGARVVELDAAHLSNIEAPVAFEEALLGHCARGLVQRARAKTAS